MKTHDTTDPIILTEEERQALEPKPADNKFLALFKKTLPTLNRAEIDALDRHLSELLQEHETHARPINASKGERLKDASTDTAERTARQLHSKAWRERNPHYHYLYMRRKAYERMKDAQSLHNGKETPTPTNQEQGKENNASTDTDLSD